MNKKIKTTISLITLLSAASTAFAGEYVTQFNWSNVRLYGHSGVSSGYTESAYQDIVNNFSLNTIEKHHAHQIYGVGRSEVAARAVANEIVARKSGVKPLFYWNANKAWNGMYESLTWAFANRPSWFAPGSNANDGEFAFPNAAARGHWMNVANNQVNNSQFDGMFIDAVFANDLRGLLPTVETLMDGLVGRPILANGYYMQYGGNMLAGPSILGHCDGVLVEFFCKDRTNTTTNLRSLIDTLLTVPNSKYIICRSGPDPVFGSTHDFSLAAYLIVANDRTFYSYGSNWYTPYSSVYDDPDFSRRLGYPQGKAYKSPTNSNIYIRNFEHATAWINIANKTSNIIWR